MWVRLRELIEEKGIMQKQLAADLGYPLQTLNNYVRGTREPDYASLCQLCDYFGCTADYMLGRSDNRLPAVTEEQAALIRTYDSLPSPIRQAVDGLLAPYAAEAAEGTKAV